MAWGGEGRGVLCAQGPLHVGEWSVSPTWPYPGQPTWDHHDEPSMMWCSSSQLAGKGFGHNSCFSGCARYRAVQ